MNRFVVVCLLLLGITFFSCETEVEQTGPERPYDPWVFRSVLDETPRVVTLALHEQIWVAYSTENASLLKAWKGRVLFEGAVYTTAHGPQPLSIGDIYFEQRNESPWLVKSGGELITSKVHYKGHKLEDGQAILKYELELGNGTIVKIEEKPDAHVADNGNLIFTRTYTSTGLPEGYSIELKAYVNSISSEKDIETNGTWNVESSNTSEIKDVQVIAQKGSLTLQSNAKTNFNISLLNTPALINPNNRKLKSQNSELQPGEKLIAKSDCKTCHNPTVKTIGPSYQAISERYPTSDGSVEQLANKIINGGGGVWGNQVMSAHLDMPVEDAKSIAAYILSLDKDDEGDKNEQGKISEADYYEPDTSINKENLISGAVVKAYALNNPVRIPDVSNLDPIMGGVLPNFDNISNSDFTNLEDDFALTGQGYLSVEKDEEITFRIWSDDGSRVTLDGNVILDHDGLHGTSMKQVNIGLKAGLHPFKIEFFNGTGGKFLSWNWKKASQEYFEVIPAEYIFHSFEAQKEVTNLSLPMSSQSKIPGDKSPLESVHPSFDLAQARPDIFTPKVGGMDFLDDGRLVISRWDPEGGVYILDGVQGDDPSKITTKRIAAGLAEPLGLKVVDNEIYVMQKQELTKLIDHDGDDIIDEYETICDDWIVSANFHEFGFGLDYKDGHFYAALAIAIMPGGASANPQGKDRGKCAKINKDSGHLEFVSHGLRTPNGVGLGFNDEIFIADNQGDWLPSSKILHVRDGAWFGSRAVDFEGTEGLTEAPPVVWLPQDEIGNSPSTPSFINVGPYKGQMIHGEVTNGGVKRVFVEQINGQLQGCLFRFIQGLEAGVNRLTWGPDDALYVGGIGNPGNWGHSGTLWYGLQRLKYNGKPCFEMLAVRARSNGMEIEFTEPLSYLDGWEKSLYEVKQWYYLPTIEYGGPKMGLETLDVLSVCVSEDRKKVFLEIDGMKEGHVVYIHLNDHLISSNRRQLWTTEAWYTLNSIPDGDDGFKRDQPETSVLNSLNKQEIEDGWELLFDGKEIAHFRNFKKDDVGKGWVIDDGAIHLNATKKDEGGWQVFDGGDIMTKKSYENYELSLEWKIGNCGNSGIIYHVTESEDYDYVWQTGPEMQVLDNTCHPDARYPTHKAGDLYDMVECTFSAVKPAGQWNKVIIVSNNGKMEHWLNGIKVVSFEMNTPEWSAMIEASKFKEMPGFGKTTKGHIALQDHGDPVWYRNIKIKAL